MLRDLGIELVGKHHSGIDDARNIARIVTKLLEGGAVVEGTGQWPGQQPSAIWFRVADALVVMRMLFDALLMLFEALLMFVDALLKRALPNAQSWQVILVLHAMRGVHF